MNTTDSTRRLIQSSWEGSDLARDHADRLGKAIDAIPRSVHVRHSETDRRDENWWTRSFVAEYIDPDTGATRWAEYYGDETGTEYADHDTRESAEEYYEENVRNLEENAEDGPWFESTDVALTTPAGES